MYLKIQPKGVARRKKKVLLNPSEWKGEFFRDRESCKVYSKPSVDEKLEAQGNC